MALYPSRGEPPRRPWTAYHPNPNVSYCMFLQDHYGMTPANASRQARHGVPPTLESIRAELAMESKP